MSLTVLSLFDYSGNMVRPWLEVGADCTIVDLLHPEGAVTEGNLTTLGGDVLDLDLDDLRPDIVFAFPPCTHLAASGARWFKSKGLNALIEALTLVERARHLAEDVYGAPFMIENPVSTLATYWRKPNHTFDPCDFGGYPDGEDDDYTKRTCLWTGHGFVFPPMRRIEPLQGSKMHRLPQTADRANLRSTTPPGFARAVFDANHPILAEQAT